MTENYAIAHRAAERSARRAYLSGRSPYVTALEDQVPNINSLPRVSLGLTELPVSSIVGTMNSGRKISFSPDFLPLLPPKSEFAQKWDQLCGYAVNEGLRDAITVYEYMNHFYVQEGNKRVSVSKYLGSYSILADVTRILPEKNGSRAVNIYYEFVRFYDVTHLNSITFTEEGRYAQLAELLGRDLETMWPAELIRDLKMAFFHFSEVFEARVGKELDITTGDAFLKYLSVYPLSDLGQPKDAIARQVDKLRKEFLTEDADDIDLVENEEALEQSRGVVKKLLHAGPRYSEKNPLKIAFLYEKNPQISAWTYGHDLGRSHLENVFGSVVRVSAYENCGSSASAEEAIKKAVSDGAEILFTTSPSLMPASLKMAVEHPELTIFNCSVYLPHQAVRAYYGKMFEAKYLLGVLAGSLSKDERIGYVADYPLLGDIASVNAFASGVSMSNPYAKVYLKWSSSKDTDYNAEFAEEGIHLISGTEFIKPDSAGRRYGLYDIQPDGSIHNLASPLWQWGRYYEMIIRNVLNGTLSSQSADHATNYWMGMSAGVIDVILSNHLPYTTVNAADRLRYAVMSGLMSPFDGELRDQQGNVRVPRGGRLSSQEIITMDWLNDNIIGEIPKMAALQESAGETLKISAVKEVLQK